MLYIYRLLVRLRGLVTLVDSVPGYYSAGSRPARSSWRAAHRAVHSPFQEEYIKLRRNLK